MELYISYRRDLISVIFGVRRSVPACREVNESREKVVVQRLDVMALQVNIEELVLVRVGSCCSCQFVWFVWFVWFVSVRVGSCRFVSVRVLSSGSCCACRFVSVRVACVDS